MEFRNPVKAIAAFALMLFVSVETRGTTSVVVADDGGSIGSIRLDGYEVPMRTGGFRVRMAGASQDIGWTRQRAEERRPGADFSAEGDDVRLSAGFRVEADRIEIRGELENIRAGERGFIVDFLVPALSPSARFSCDLDSARPLDTSREGTRYPIGAMSDERGGVAVAIPPTQPRVFGVAGDREGMHLRFYLGTSPLTRDFPSRASFEFVIYRIHAGGDFRGALERYYEAFPDFYTPRLKKDGLFMFQMADRVPANVDQYGFDEVEPQWGDRVLEAAIRRDEAHGISTFPYTIVGQREIKFLPKLPAGYDAAMDVFSRWTVADHAGHLLTKENVSSEGDIHLKEEVQSSACQGPDGRFSIVLRNTPWGGDSITFKINPNPGLFAGSGRRNVGGDVLAVADKWIREHPEYDGIYVDSLGANWPAVLNYRRDHFAFARYPLTFDPAGRVALQNTISHYEYLETLRERIHAVGRLVLGNGVYSYRSRGTPSRGVERQSLDRQFTEFTAVSALPEDPRPGVELSRFFCAALLDLGSSEAGSRATLDRCRDVRVHMGRKQYAFLNYHWEDARQVEEFVNKSLAYAIFASSSTNFMTGVRYEDNPHGYLRDKPLLDWFVPLVRRLSRAGWEPVRHARLPGSPGTVACERFGSGKTMCFTLYNDGDSPVNCTVKLDLAALGFTPGRVRIAEIARSARIEVEGASVTLLLPPKKTHILEVSSAGG